MGLVETAFLNADSGARVGEARFERSRVEIAETGAFLPGALALLNLTGSTLRSVHVGALAKEVGLGTITCVTLA